MKLGIRAKLFLISLGLIAASVAAAGVYLATVLDADLTRRERDDLLVRLSLVERDASAFEGALDDRASWDRLADELGRRCGGRVTIVRKDGAVLGDSEVELSGLAQLENHADRPEIVEAFSKGRGSSVHFSSTLKERMLYLAVPFERGGTAVGAVRLAQPLTAADEALSRARHLILVAAAGALALATLLSFLAARWMSRTVHDMTAAARRMAGGDLAARVSPSGHDELAELGRALDQLAGGLQGALATLRQERDLLGRVLEGMREGVLLLDGSGRVALTNAALRGMLLLGPDVAGKSPLELVRDEALEEILEHASASPEPVSGELEVGELKPRRLLVHATSLEGGVLAVFVDVTDLRRLETVRRDFVANVSHELRTPVASVRASAETLRRAMETQPEAALDFVEIIERNADRLHRLIEDLLDLSRIESREFRLVPGPVDVAQAARQTLSLFEERARARQLRLSDEVAADLPAARADRRALEQVLTNLVDNAVKYCTPGAAVTIKASRAEAMLRVSVEDTGPGIEAKHLPRLFERFYRVDTGRSRELGGTGLGLSIVKHLVEAMQGHVSVESAPGRGSSFAFTLPVVAGTSEAATTARP